MKTEYLVTLSSAGMVLLIVAIWTLCVMIERRRTAAPDVPPDYWQRDLFAVVGALIVAACAAVGV